MAVTFVSAIEGTHIDFDKADWNQRDLGTYWEDYEESPE